MRLLHGLAKIHATFDDPHLVSQAGLVPVMALAERAGLDSLVAGHVRLGGPCGANARMKVPCLVAGMTAGADSIDDMAVLGENHPGTLASANNLAADLRALGEYQAARELDEDTLARSRRVLGEAHPGTLVSAATLPLTCAHWARRAMTTDCGVLG
jgi:hypothetical protein